MLALDGKPDDHFRWLLVELLNKLDWLAEELRRLDAQIAASSGTYTDVFQRLAPISGVDGTTTLILVAEFDLDMTCFPTAGHLGELGGFCPGNAESADKRFSGRTRKGDRYVRRILVQSAWAAIPQETLFPGYVGSSALRTDAG